MGCCDSTIDTRSEVTGEPRLVAQKTKTVYDQSGEAIDIPGKSKATKPVAESTEWDAYLLMFHV